VDARGDQQARRRLARRTRHPPRLGKLGSRRGWPRGVYLLDAKALHGSAEVREDALRSGRIVYRGATIRGAAREGHDLLMRIGSGEPLGSRPSSCCGRSSRTTGSRSKGHLRSRNEVVRPSDGLAVDAPGRPCRSGRGRCARAGDRSLAAMAARCGRRASGGARALGSIQAQSRRGHYGAPDGGWRVQRDDWADHKGLLVVTLLDLGR
jgi:hypothetical protein